RHVKGAARWPHARLLNAIDRAMERVAHRPGMASVQGRVAETNRRQSPSASAAESDDNEEQERADGCGQDLRANAGAEMKSDAREQHAGGKRAKNPNDDVSNETKSHTTNDAAGQPAGDRPHEQDHEQTFV